MKPYRVKHIKTGLYYKPSASGSNNLSRTGKIYATKNSVLSKKKEYLTVHVSKYSPICKKLHQFYIGTELRLYRCPIAFKIPYSDFEIEFLN